MEDGKIPLADRLSQKFIGMSDEPNLIVQCFSQIAVIESWQTSY
jgi:hypothetical protein